ncbi:hypothetical protein Thimo_0130 [Thioflavicoccus mobilis 8321]|uniref:DUF502 domain-containing protein n=1 Tax=Thioflavicoccus mobilis 8321 TaxID=765912 RepID=L0GUI0_9GAMM|nr:DUF502 domain-containing protein [Thioflavicoccus mobilis]AGA89005.1 hypothetical protein Thimo_0130 [Thioflavicoccus mobilis 8321]
MLRHFNRYLLTGIITIIPILVTVFVFEFFLRQLSNFGKPTVRAMTLSVREFSPDLARWMLEVPWLQSLLAILFTIAAIYLLGWGTSIVIGRRLLTLLEALVERIPLVTKVYGSTKQLVQSFQRRPDLQRVVLIEFPHKEMKAVGFVTETMRDEESGVELAAVYVPTTPNPTSGYLEIVPKERLISLDWSVDEAMTFIISGGTVSPGRIRWGVVASADEVGTGSKTATEEPPRSATGAATDRD